MNLLLHPELVKMLHGFWYRFRFLCIYMVIGALSLFLELAIRSQLLLLGVHVYHATTLSLILGILFAFFGNIYFIVAKKIEASVTPIKPKWVKPRKLSVAINKGRL